VSSFPLNTESRISFSIGETGRIRLFEKIDALFQALELDDGRNTIYKEDDSDVGESSGNSNETLVTDIDNTQVILLRFWNDDTGSAQSTSINQAESSDLATHTGLDLLLLDQWWKSALQQISIGELSNSEQLLATILDRAERYGIKDGITTDALKVLAAVYSRQKMYEAAEHILERLRGCKPSGKFGSEAMHAVARAHLTNREFLKASRWGTEAIEWRKESVGEQHVLYYQSLDLMAEILDAQGRFVDAKELRSLLPRNYDGKLLSCIC
jgi:hypothetical protein